MGHAINNLRQSLRALAAQIGLPAFWRWWMGALAPLVPSGPRNALQRRRLRPVLAFDHDVAVLWQLNVVDGALSLVESARVPLTGDSAVVARAGRAAIEAFPRRSYGGMTTAIKVFIALPRSQVLRKRLALPAVVEENLKEALSFDLDRHTPFRADQLYFDAAVVTRDVARNEIGVDLAAALRTVVDPARRHAESWGATVVGITPESLDGAAGGVPRPAAWSRLNLLPIDERPDAFVWRRPHFWVPATLVVALALFAVALPIWQKRDYVIALNEITEQARLQAAASDALRQQLDRVTGDYNFALGRKYAFPGMVQLLDDVTRLLPDDTWITQLEVKSMPKGKEPHREIMLRGESANAGRLVGALEDSKLFEQAAPRSPTTKIQPGPGEVFDLGAQLKPMALPETVQLARVAPAAPPTAGAGAATPPAPAQAEPGVPAAAPVPAAAGGPAAAPAAAPASPAAPAKGAAPAAADAAPRADAPPAAPQAAHPPAQRGNPVPSGSVPPGVRSPGAQGGRVPRVLGLPPQGGQGAAPSMPPAGQPADDAGAAPAEDAGAPVAQPLQVPVPPAAGGRR